MEELHASDGAADALVRIARLCATTPGDRRVRIVVLDDAPGSIHARMVERTIFRLAPGCTIETISAFDGGIDRLAASLHASVDLGACIVNLSGVVRPRGRTNALTEALDTCARRGAVVVAAAGNDAAVAPSVVTGHPTVLPVVGCDLAGEVATFSNLASSFARRGVMAPADGGTSMAAPIVSAAIALLSSHFPGVALPEVAASLLDSRNRRLLPPLLDVERGAARLAAASTARKRT